jgi:tetratricopeptide (TPR) repeat protein
MKTEYATRYQVDLNNLLRIAITSGHNVDVEDIISRVENLSAGSKENNATLFSEVYFLQQLYLLNKGHNEKALQLIPKIENGLKQFGNSIRLPRVLTFIYNISVTYFMNEHYAEAMQSFDRIITANRKHEVRTDLRDVSGIFKIILLYQTGKHDLVEYEVRNTRDRLKYGNKLYELEQIVLEYIPLLIKSKREIPNFLAKLEALFARPENKNLLGLEEIIIWLRKK